MNVFTQKVLALSLVNRRSWWLLEKSFQLRTFHSISLSQRSQCHAVCTLNSKQPKFQKLPHLLCLTSSFLTGLSPSTLYRLLLLPRVDNGPEPVLLHQPDNNITRCILSSHDRLSRPIFQLPFSPYVTTPRFSELRCQSSPSVPCRFASGPFSRNCFRYLWPLNYPRMIG